MKAFICKLILSACLFCHTTAGSAYNLRQINNKDGLSNSAILSLGQDTNHLMLFGTCDGLNIFDGKDIQVIRASSSEQTIVGNIIERIHVTQPGTYWIRTNSGLNRLNLQKGKVSLFPEFAGENFIFTDQQDNLFVYDKTGHLHLFNEQAEQFQPVSFRQTSAIPYQDILSIKFDSKNRLRIYARQGYCYCFSLHNESTTAPYLTLLEKQQLMINITRSFPDGDDECVIDQDQNLYGVFV